MAQTASSPATSTPAMASCPWRTFKGWTRNTWGFVPRSETRVHGSSCRTFCRRSRSTSITFPGEPRAMTRALGRVQGPRYRAARSRSRRCVSGISDKSTRNSAWARAFSARNASSLNQLLDRGPSNTTFLGHTFRVLARDLKPGAQMGALDVLSVSVNTHPLKSEMSVATPKAQTKEPIQLDIAIVCRKASPRLPDKPEQIKALLAAQEKLSRLESVGFKLSRNDERAVLFGQLLTTIGSVAEIGEITEAVENTLNGSGTGRGPRG